MNGKRILAYGEDSLVISTRAMILQRAGYEVVQTTNAEDVFTLLTGISFDLLLIGDSVRNSSHVRLARHVRSSFPKLLIAMVQDEREERDPWSTIFVNSAPEQLLKSISTLWKVEKKPVLAESSGHKIKGTRPSARH
jgi:PleD family two-component response regulator